MQTWVDIKQHLFLENTGDMWHNYNKLVPHNKEIYIFVNKSKNKTNIKTVIDCDFWRPPWQSE